MRLFGRSEEVVSLIRSHQLWMWKSLGGTGLCLFGHQQLLTVITAAVRAGQILPLCPRMPLLQGVLSQVLSWTGLSQVLLVVGAGLGAVMAYKAARLLVRHAWYTHRLSCFRKPHASSWLLGHLGQVGFWSHTHTHTHNAAYLLVLWL